MSNIQNIKLYEGLRIIGTYSCKRSCKFCYQKYRIGRFLDTDDLITALKNINFIPAYITFMGGELSYFPEKTYNLISIVHNKFPCVYSKSLTTNGDGDLLWYKSLKFVGLTRFTFSIHNKNMLDILNLKILKLAQNPNFTVRINCYFNKNNIDDCKDILLICKKYDIPLTFCLDINEKDYGEKYIKYLILKLSNKINIKVFDNFLINTLDDYNFWVFRHNNNYNKNNYIILPNGQYTDNFDDVLECSGN